MKARLPQQPNRQEMLKKLQQMQEDMQTRQAELDACEYDTSSGGGAVKVKINGKREILRITIDPSAIDPSDAEMLEDLVTAAVNEAIRTVDKAQESGMESLTGGLDLSAMSGGLF